MIHATQRWLISPYQERLFQTFTPCASPTLLLTGTKSSPPTNICPKIVKFTSHEGIVDWEVFATCFTRSQRSLKEDRNWCRGGTFLLTEQGKVQIMKASAPPLTVQFLWAPLPDLSAALRSLSTTFGRTSSAIYQREVIQEKTNLLIRFSEIHVAWRSGSRAGSSTRHAAGSHVEGLRVGVNLAVNWRWSKAELLDKRH